MKTKEIKKQIKGTFVLPKKKYYFGKVNFGCPYFYPRNYCSKIIIIRRLILKSKEDYNEFKKRYPHLSNGERCKFVNFPMVTTYKHFIKKFFGRYYLIQLGLPVSIRKIELGWKDKFGSPRYEWSPQFHIYFFGFQFVIWWNAPDGDNDTYYEMILHYLYYTELPTVPHTLIKDIVEAEKQWRWQDATTKESTWNNKYLIKYEN